MKKITLILITIFALTSLNVFSDISPEAKRELAKKKNQKQLAPAGFFDNRQASLSNLEFYVSNDGRFSLDIANIRGGGYWPRNSRNQYIFGGGAWFAARKRFEATGEFREYVEMTYDPRFAESNFVPGRIRDKNGALTPKADQNDIYKYRTYSSSDFNTTTGQALASDEQSWPTWPIWDIVQEDTLKVNRYFGNYVEDEDLRNVENYPKGPAFISGEDIFATFKDSDLNYYRGGATTLRNFGFPLNVQIEHMVYSWGFGQYKDFVFLKYDFLNMSNDTLYDCWHAPIMDVDIARSPSVSAGATNDRVRWYDCGTDDGINIRGDTLNMAVQWSDDDQGERGFGFGYLGFDYLESPAVIRYFWIDKRARRWNTREEIIGAGISADSVEFYLDKIRTNPHYAIRGDLNPSVSIDTLFEIDPATGQIAQDSISVVPTNPIRDVVTNSNGGLDTLYYPYFFNMEGDTLFPRLDFIDSTGFLRKTKRVFPENDQLGLVTFRNWSIADDVVENVAKYNFISSRFRDGDTGPGDKRFMMATGPYNMLPFDTSRVVVGIILARNVGSGEADGSCGDMENLRILDIFAQEVYDQEFRAPIPPDRPIITAWTSLNNGAKIEWDNTSELSYDDEGNGLDFLGYKIYRARRPDLDTFSTIPTNPGDDFANGSGPLGWKEIASYEIPTPFVKTNRKVGGDPTNPSFPFIDSIRVIGGIRNRGLDEPTEYYDQFAIRVMRIPNGSIQYTPRDAQIITNNNNLSPQIRNKPIPIIAAIDTSQFSAPWGSVFYDIADGDQLFSNNNSGALFYNPDSTQFNETSPGYTLMNDVIAYTIFLDRSTINYNPLLYRKFTVEYTSEIADRIRQLDNDPRIEKVDDDQYVIRKNKEVARDSTDDQGNIITITDTVETTTIDTVFYTQSINFFNRGDETIRFIDIATKRFIELDSIQVNRTFERDSVDTNGFPVLDKNGNKIIIKYDSLVAELDPKVNLVRDSIMNSREIEIEILEFLYDLMESGSGIERIAYPRIFDRQDTVVTFTVSPSGDTTFITEIVDVFEPFEQTGLVRQEVMNEYFASITNNRTFVDVGDDNRDNNIDVTDDPLTTERLNNNTSYFYKVVPFDEGDTGKELESLQNNPPFSPGAITSIVEVTPTEAPSGKLSEFQVIEVDSSKIGSINNINFFSIDGQRLQQQYAGDTLELEIQPFWYQEDWIPTDERNEDKRMYFNLYGGQLTIRNLTDSNKVIYNSSTRWEEIPGQFSFVKSPTEFAASWSLTPALDSIAIIVGVEEVLEDVLDSTGVPTGEQVLVKRDILETVSDLNKVFGKDVDVRKSTFSTGRFREKSFYSNGWVNEAYGLMGFEFDYTLKQFGGVLRPFEGEKFGDAQSVSTFVGLVDPPQIGIPNNRVGKQPKRVMTAQTYVFPERSNRITRRIDDDAPDGSLETVIVNVPENGISSFNNGPGDYVLEFSQGGSEQVDLTWQSGGQNKTFNVNYLNVTLRNVTDFKRFDEVTGDSVPILYDEIVEHMDLPAQPVPAQFTSGQDYFFYPHPRNLTFEDRDPQEFIGKYNIFSVGYVNTRSRFSPLFGFTRQFAYPSNTPYSNGNLNNNTSFTGLQGRYYLSGVSTDGQDTVDFVHMVNIGGTLFSLDYARLGKAENNSSKNNLEWENSYLRIKTEELIESSGVRDTTYGSNFGNDIGINGSNRSFDGLGNDDFKPGHQVRLKNYGGVQGLPWSGATIKVAVTEGSNDQTSFSEGELEPIRVVPNPFYVIHENVQSPYVTEIFFTRLPSKCTIDIYTQAGQLVKTIKHDGFENGELGVNVWGLLTESGLRVQSQTLIALITAPDGTTVSRPFSVVVGSYRILN